MGERPPSFWFAYYYDFSEFAIFESELPALRYAVQNNMQVRMVGEGVGIRELLA